MKAGNGGRSNGFAAPLAESSPIHHIAGAPNTLPTYSISPDQRPRRSGPPIGSVNHTIELISPTTKSYKICLRRRSVQSQAESGLSTGRIPVAFHRKSHFSLLPPASYITNGVCSEE